MTNKIQINTLILQITIILTLTILLMSSCSIMKSDDFSQYHPKFHKGYPCHQRN